MRIIDWSSDVCSSDLIFADERTGGVSGELIFLGDLINRGPQSAQVIDRLINLRAQRPETRFLLGNHEELFLTALDGNREAIRFFDRVGGAETILSYGITPEAYDAADYAELSAMLQRSEARRVGKEGVSTGQSRW